MQLTVDIPEPLYRELEERARHDHTSLEHLILHAAKSAIRSTNGTRVVAKPRLIHLNVNFNDFTLMSDDEVEVFEKIAEIDLEAALRAFGIRRLDDAA